MRHANRNSALVTALLIATTTCRSPSLTTEERAFERNCAACHSTRSLAVASAGLDDPEKAAALDRFLAGHHAPGADTRRQIIDHLAGQNK